MPVVDEGRIRKPDRDVEARRSEFLKIRRAADLDERIMRLLSVQGVGLQPLLTPGNTVCALVRHHTVASRHHIGDDSLACKRREDGGHLAVADVVFVFRTRNDHAHDAVLRDLGDRACIVARGRIDGSGQAVGQRHVEHVVRHLSRGVAGAAGIVEQSDFETAQPRFIRREHIHSAAGVVLAVQRIVVLVHEDGDLCRRKRRLLQKNIDRGSAGRDLCATHAVAAGAGPGGEVRAGGT